MGNAQSAKDTEQRDQALGQPRGDIRIPSGGRESTNKGGTHDPPARC